MKRSDTSGDIKLFGYGIFPDFVNCIDIFLIARKCCHIGNTRIQVCSPHCMTNRFGLLYKRNVVLRIELLRIGDFSTAINEKFSQIQVFFLTGNPVQPHQPHFYNFMTRSIITFSGTENLHQQIGIFQCNI